MISIVEETSFFSETLQAREFRGLGDTREAARHRVAKATGVSESYLKRLRYEAHVMRDVLGSAYRALRDAYEAAVEEEQRRGDAAMLLREAIEHGLATDTQPPSALVAGAKARPLAQAAHARGRQ